MGNQNVNLIIQPKAKDLGDNFTVRRSLPQREKRLVGPFIFWDHMGPVEITPEKEMKVRAHPHIGLATITYLFSGEIFHRDSLGNEQIIRPGEVNWMTAGRGIVHSERSPANSHHSLEGIQLWVALSKEHEEVEPSFVHYKEQDLPLIESKDLQLRLIAGSGLGQKSPVPVYSDLFYFHGIAQSGHHFTYELNKNQEGAIYLTEGEVEIDGALYESVTLIIFKQGSKIEFKAGTEAKFMLFGGEVFPEGRNIWWNFVATDKEKIETAKEAWKNGEFPEVINETEKIPLPKN